MRRDGHLSIHAMKNRCAIPKVIWQTYKSRELPVKGQLASETWKSLNPGWDYRLCDDDEITQFIDTEFGGELADVFRSVPLGVMKADIWRYAILLKNGGVYADIDTSCLVPLDWWEMTWEHLRIALEDSAHFCQWVIAAAPGQPVFEKVLRLIVERARCGIDTTYEHFVHWHTGPAVWTAGICEELELPLQKSSVIYESHRRQAEARRIQILPNGVFSGVLVSHAFASKYYSRHDYVRWVDERDRIRNPALLSGTGAATSSEATRTRSPGKYAMNSSNARDLCLKHLESIPPAPPAANGRAVVFCVSDCTSFVGAWVAICTLRYAGCSLPIQIWHESQETVDQSLQSVVKPLGVQCIDVAERHCAPPVASPEGLDLRSFAAIFGDFDEILFLHDEFLPIRNPEPLFQDARFLSSGAVFWPDSSPLTGNNPIWRTLGVCQGQELGFDKGAILINRRKCWKALHAALLINECADFFGRFIDGYKDAFYLSFLLAGQLFEMPAQAAEISEAGVRLAGFEGKLLFQHRKEKWSIFNHNQAIQGFPHEAQCREFLKELGAMLNWEWGRNRRNLEPGPEFESDLMRWLLASCFDFHRKGYDHRLITFRPDGTVGQGAADNELFWKLRKTHENTVLEFFSLSRRTATLTYSPDALRWEGMTTIMSNEVHVEMTAILRNSGPQ
jgi:hypothetical protein